MGGFPRTRSKAGLSWRQLPQIWTLLAGWPACPSQLEPRAPSDSVLLPWGLWHHTPGVGRVAETGQRETSHARSGAEPGEGQAAVASRRRRREEEPPEQDKAGHMGRDELEQPKAEQSYPWPQRGRGRKPGPWQGKEHWACRGCSGRHGVEELRCHLWWLSLSITALPREGPSPLRLQVSMIGWLG